MPHARIPDGSGKTDQSSPSPGGLEPKPSRHEVGRKLEDASGLGDRSALPERASDVKLVADPLPATKPSLFLFDVQGVRVVGDATAPRFVAKDVCQALEIQNTSQALANLEPDEKGVCNTYTLGGPQELLTINESGLYALIFRSRKPVARLFRRWVTGEVLPAIRQRGSYERAQATRPPPTPTIEIYQHPVRPAPPGEEMRVCELLDRVLGPHRERVMVTAATLGHVAVREEILPVWIYDEHDTQQRAKLLRNLVRYYRRWLYPAPDSLSRYCIVPEGAGKMRRYHITKGYDSPPRPLITLARTKEEAISIVDHALTIGNRVVPV